MVAIWIADVVLNSVLVRHPTGIIWPVEQFGYVGPCPPLAWWRRLFGRHRLHLLLARPMTASTGTQGSGVGHPRRSLLDANAHR
jgi:hypothetical protein